MIQKVDWEVYYEPEATMRLLEIERSVGDKRISSSRALAAASVRLFTANFEKILLTWRLIVLVATTNCSAIVALEAPLASRCNTSNSRVLNGSISGRLDLALTVVTGKNNSGGTKPSGSQAASNVWRYLCEP